MTGALSAATFNVPKPASLSATSTAGGMRLTYRGATNFQYQILVSSNLQSWTILSSNVAVSQALTNLDTQATNKPMRFYKAASLRTPFFYQGTYSGTASGGSGGYILFARTNGSLTFLGVSPGNGFKRGEYANSLVVGSNDLTCGTYVSGAPGCLQFASNTLTGKFTNAPFTGTLTGIQKANLGLFNGAAGRYTGPVTDGHTGSATLLLCPDGAFAFYRTDNDTGKNDGGVSSMNTDRTVDVYLSGSTALHLTGSFNTQTRTFSLLIHEEAGAPLSLITMTLAEPLF